MSLIVLFVALVATIWLAIMISIWFAVRTEVTKVQELEAVNAELRAQLRAAKEIDP